MIQFNQFNGGLNTRLAPHLIGINEATIYTNIDNSKVSLVPIHKDTDENQTVYKYLHNFKGSWISSTTYKNYIEFQEKLYYSDGVGIPQKSSDGTTWYNLGISKPTVKPTVTKIEAPSLTASTPVAYTVPNITSAKSLSLDAGGDLTAGTYKYKLFNKINSTTSIVYEIEGTVTGSDNAIKLYDIQGIHNQVYVYRLYSGTYRLVGVTTSDNITDKTLDISGNEALVKGTEFPLGETVRYAYDAYDSTNDLRTQYYNSIELSTQEKTYLIELYPTGDGSKSIYRYYDGEYRECGLIDDVYDISSGAIKPEEEDYLQGTYQYAYTYYGSSDGSESRASDYSDEIEVTNGIINVTYTGSSDSQVDKCRLYRIGGTLQSMSLVEELSNPTGSTTYTDKLSDLDIPGTLLDTYKNGQAPSGLNYLTEHNAMFFGAVGDKLWYSDIAYVNNWSVYNFIDFDATITGLGAVPNGLLVFTKYKTYIVTGTSPSTLSKYLLNDSQGCIDHRSIQYVKNTLIWLSTDGICVSNGGEIDIISRNKLDKSDIPTTINDAIVYDDVYYISSSSGTLAADFRYSLIFRKLDTIVDGFSIYNDTLYYSLSSKLYSFSTSSELRSMNYRSPLLLNTPSYLNMLYNFKVDYKGSITVKLYADDVLVVTKSLSSSSRIPQEIIEVDNLLCSSMYVEISGTGELYSFNYEVLDKSNIANSLKFYATDSFKEIVKVNNQPVEFNKTTTGYKNILPISMTDVKLFKNLYITYIGDLSFKLYLNGTKAIDKTFSSGSITTEELLIPSKLSRAYFVEVEYSGKLYDIEIDPLRRQTNGR